MDKHPAPLTNLLASVRTNLEADSFVEQIDTFLANLYKSERKSITNLIQETFPEERTLLINDYLVSLAISPTHHEEVRQALSSLEASLKKMKILSLTLALALPMRSLNVVAEWVKKEFGTDVMVEVTLNPELIAGAIIVFEGRYIDQSVKKRLEILFEAKEEEITKLLHG